MKILLAIILILVLCNYSSAQEISPKTRQNIIDVGKALERLNRAPLPVKYYKIYVAGGNIFMSEGNYKKALKLYNKALAIFPNGQEALVGANYCRQMLKSTKRSKR
jgi:tetratricopeptide (TPR) repeat protein